MPSRTLLPIVPAAGTGFTSRSAVGESTTTQPEPEEFFTLGRRKGRWFFIDPEGQPFFSLGINHIDRRQK